MGSEVVTFCHGLSVTGRRAERGMRTEYRCEVVTFCHGLKLVIILEKGGGKLPLPLRS